MSPALDRWRRLLIWLVPHLLAATVTFAAIAAVPTSAFYVEMVACDAVDGPSLAICLGTFLIVGTLTTALVCPAAIVLQWLRPRLRFSWWVPMVLVFPACFTGALLLARTSGTSDPLTSVLVLSGSLSVGFWLYWAVHGACGALIARALRTPQASRTPAV